MSNMSYRRFQNVVEDMQECSDALDEILGDLSRLSEDEAEAAARFIQLCKKVAEDHSD